MSISGNPEPRRLDLEYAAELRTELGLPMFSTYPEQIAGEAVRNLEERGWYLTDAELVDLQDRNRLGDRMSERLEEISQFQGFAGAELVHSGRGTFRIYWARSEPTRRVQLILDEIDPDRTEVVLVPFSERELIEEIGRAWHALESQGVSGSVLAISPSDDFAGLEVEIDPKESALVRSQVSATLRASQRSSVNVVEGEVGVDEACTNRANCTSPMRAGNRLIRGNVGNTTQWCTMGFHVRHGADEQFLSAAHCSHATRSNFWYHPGLVGPWMSTGQNLNGFVGARTATAYGTPPVPGAGNTTVVTSRDVMRVQLNDAQVSNDIFADGSVVGHYTPAQTYIGMSVCKSGPTTFLTCGLITKKFHTHTSPACGCLNVASQAQYWSGDGDSGAPVYHRLGGGGGGVGSVMAVGVHTGRSGGKARFTRLQDALSKLNVTLVTS